MSAETTAMEISAEIELPESVELSREFDASINRLGRVTSIIMLFLMFMVPFGITMAYGIKVQWSEVSMVAFGLIAMFAPMAVVENISYYPIMGAGGVYLSCITGNIMNMKLPSALSGMKLAGVEPGSREGDVISIISVGVSSITTVTILVMGMFFIGELLSPILATPMLKPAFANIMPSLLGALFMPFVLKNVRMALVPLGLSMILCFALGVGFVQRYQSYIMPVVMLSSVAAAWIMHKKGILQGKKAK